jgi:hypothetical protein
MDRNKVLSRRNAGGIYLLQGLIRCGDCNSCLNVQRYRRVKSSEGYFYRCNTASQHPHEPHPRPTSRNGPELDWAVWRHLVDYGIKRPDLIVVQVQVRRAELLAEGESADGQIAQVRYRLSAIDQERAFYQRQAARGMITEAEFDQRMGETEASRQYCQSELIRLQELRDDAAKVDAGLVYATELLTALQKTLPAIDQQPDELEALPGDKRIEVMTARQRIIRALCDTVYIYADGRVRIEGMLDGSEAAQFDLPTC